MAQKKKKFTKEQNARKLGNQSYIMDGWEKQFDIEPLLRNGEKIYTRKHLSQLRSIKELLYEKGFTIDAAKNYFKDQKDLEGTTLIAASPLNFDSQQKPTSPLDVLVQPAPISPPLQEQNTQLQQVQEVKDKLKSVREQLLKISNSL